MPRQVATVTHIASTLRTAHPDAKIGFVGFCWGGRFSISLNHLFDASVACHPSLVRFPAELAGIKGPFSLAAAAGDKQYNAARAKETEKILRERGMKDVEVKVYEGVHHGWTCRGDMADEVQRKAREDAVEQVVDWFGKYLIPAPASAPAGLPAREPEPEPAPEPAPAPALPPKAKEDSGAAPVP